VRELGSKMGRLHVQASSCQCLLFMYLAALCHVLLQRLMVLEPREHLLGLCHLLKLAKDHVGMTGIVSDCVCCSKDVA
jgi:hypothetical protein